MSKYCIHKDCNKIPYYNLSTKMKPLYCKEHKKENMIDIVHKNVFIKNVIKDLIIIYQLK